MSAALAEDIKIAVVGAMSGPVAQYGDRSLLAQSRRLPILTRKAGLKANKLQMVNTMTLVTRKHTPSNKVVNDGLNTLSAICAQPSTQPASDIYEDEGS